MNMFELMRKSGLAYTFELCDNIIVVSSDKDFSKSTYANYLTKNGDFAKDEAVFSALAKWGANQSPPLKENEVVDLFVRKFSYNYAKFITQWQGYNVYEPCFNKSDIIPATDGILYIFVKGDIIKQPSTKEVNEFINECL